MSGKTARHRGGHDAKRTERLSAGQMQDRVTEMAYPVRGPRIQKGQALTEEKASRTANLSTQTPQVGVVSDYTRKRSSIVGVVLETLAMSLQVTHDVLIPPSLLLSLFFCSSIKQDSSQSREVFPKRKIDLARQREREKIILLLSTKCHLSQHWLSSTRRLQAEDGAASLLHY